jgi:mRNA-degrading endonuclease HigB of HigAB toxin-antitoxin module
VDNIVGKVYIAHRDVERGNVRFVRIGEEIKKLKFPPRKNFLAVFKGEQDFQSAIKFLKGFFEGVKAQFRSPEKVKLLENYAIRVIGDSVVIVDVKRAAFRVIFDKLIGGRLSTRNLSIPLEVKLPEKVREILQKFGFGFSGERLVSVPDLPVNVSIESLENFGKFSQNLEDEEVIVRNLARFLSEGRLKDEEVLLSELLMCNNPYYDPEGKVIMMMIPLEEIREYFGG